MEPVDQTGDTPSAGVQVAPYDLVWRCERCTEIFKDYETFLKHYERYSRFKDEAMQDEIGNRLITEKMAMAVVNAIYACEFCDSLFSDKRAQLKHSAQHTYSYDCTFCGKTFFRLNGVLEHRTSCTQYKSFWAKYQYNVAAMYSCNVCTSQFDTLPELYEHRHSELHYFLRRVPGVGASHLEDLWYICEICGYFCKRLFIFQRHLKKDHSNGVVDPAGVVRMPTLTGHFLCEKCANQPRAMEPVDQTGDTPSAELQIVPYDLVWKCERCSEIFKDYKAFVEHGEQYAHFSGEAMQDEIGNSLTAEKMAMAFVVEIYACEFCDSRFVDKMALFSHEARHTSSYDCKLCGESFCMLHAVLEHRAQCLPYKNFWATSQYNVMAMYSCNVCMALFDTLPELYDHRYSDRHYFPRRLPEVQPSGSVDDLWYICETCGYFCKRSTTLTQHHTKTHAIAVPDGAGTVRMAPTDCQFLCDRCGKLFKKLGHLTTHMQFHLSIKPFACLYEGCTFRAAVPSGLRDHIRHRHTGEPPYECEECHKRFRSSAGLCAHRSLHRQDRPYTCTVCGSHFQRNDALRSHMMMHTGEQPFVCVHCGRKYRLRPSWAKHMRLKHKNQR
uniref:C2H2-type domain-containing protein n=1 Tax=Anopheles funestus TaxID=62324 RepID=A0A182RMU2_ANOFN